MMQEPPPRPDLGWSAPPIVDTDVEDTGVKGMHGGPPTTWTIWGAVGVFLANLLILQPIVSVVILLAMGVDQPASSGGGAGFPELAATLGADIATVIAIVIWLSTRHPGWVQVLGLPAKGKRLKEIAIAIGLGPLVYAGIALLVVPIIALLLGAIAGSGATTPDQIDTESLSAGGKLLTVLVAVVVAPITEELVFRGILFRSLRDRRGFWVGAIVSSLLFGMVHLVLPAPWQDVVLLQVTMVFTGMALAAIYEWRGNLLSCIVTHMSFNVVGVILILVVAKGA